MGSQKRSLLLLNLSRCLLNCADQQLLSLSNLGAEVLLIGEQVFKVNELFVNEHAGDATNILREELSNNRIDDIANELFSILRCLDFLKLGKTNLRKRKKGLLLLLSVLAVISLRVVSVATSSTSLVVITMIRVALLISTLVSIILIAVTTLVLIVGGHTHECGDNLLGLSVFLALSLLFFFFLRNPHLNSDGL
jgi:hypothetical protein